MIQFDRIPRGLQGDAAYLTGGFLPVWVVDRRLRVVWANAVSGGRLGLPPETVAGQPLEKLLVSAAGQSWERLLAPAGKTGPRSFPAYLNPETNGGLQGTFISGTRVDVRGIRRGVHWVFFLKPVDSPLVKEYVSNAKDFILSLDEEDRILRVVPNFFLAQWLKTKPVFRQPVTALLKKEEWDDFKRRKEASALYLRQYAAQPRGPWRPAFREDFHDLSRWQSETMSSHWRAEAGGGLRFAGRGEVAYLYARETADVVGREFSMAVTLSLSGRGRAAMVFNQAHPTQWDSSGYNLGIGFQEGKLQLTFKKNTRFLFYHPLTQPRREEYRLKMEKTGGLFRIFVNGILEKEIEDLAPLSNHGAHFGLMTSDAARFSAFEILTREGDFDEARTLSKPSRFTLPPLPDRVFEMSEIPVEDWTLGSEPRILDALLFADVTEIAAIERDRDTLHERVAFLKQKDYFGFVGGNPKILDLVEKVEAFADSAAGVLIEGPTGSGKEVLARAIHLRSNRRERPFVKVDCASLPHALLESELFGHEKGAFTGAVARAAGRFEAADQGTLFLDEIGNIDLSLQAKLLGFLEDREFTPLGGGRPVKVDVRIVAATNAPLETMVRKGLFREDLYYRLKVIHVSLPPLKERRDDIPLLVDRFLAAINQRNKMKVEGVSPQVMEDFLKHPWPGNVRELYNVLLNLAVQKKKGVIDQRPELTGFPRGPGAPRVFVPEPERHAAILKIASEKPYFSARDGLSSLPVSLPTIKRDLRILVSAGKLARQGKGPAARYRKI